MRNKVLLAQNELENGRFPLFEGESPNEEETEQEWRLFYVAITRAIERLALIVAVR